VARTGPSLSRRPPNGGHTMQARASAALLSRLVCAISCPGRRCCAAGGGGRSPRAPAAGGGGSTRHALQADEPILADYLAVGVPSRSPEALLQPANETGSSISATSRTISHEKTPFSAGHARTLLRERRLVAAALRPRAALQQVPAVEQPTRSRLDTGELRPRPQALPSLFAPQPAPLSGRQAEGKLAPVGGAPPDEPWAAASSAGQPARRVPQVRDLPKDLRTTIARALLADFSREVATDAVSGTSRSVGNRGVLSKWEWEVATRLCAEGSILGTVRHLAAAELHITHGPERRRLLRAWVDASAGGASAAPPREHPVALRSERQQLLQEWSHAEAPVGERTILGMYLDGRLSWLRIRPRWQPARSSPPVAGEGFLPVRGSNGVELPPCEPGLGMDDEGSFE